MENTMKKIFSKVWALGLIGAMFAVTTFAQTYPVTTPTYIPQAILPAVSYTGIGVTGSYQINGVATLNIAVTGAPVGMTAVVQVTESRASTATWVNLPVDAIDGDRYLSITATGSYRVNVAGYAQARVNITALSSGTATFAFSGGVGDNVIGVMPVNKHTYSAAITGLVPAASATDLITIKGSSAAAIRVTRVACNGQATASGNALVQLITRSNPTTGGTSSVATAVPHDPNDSAANASVVSYTANPTAGSAVGTVRSGYVNLPASNVVGASLLEWEFGAQNRTASKEIILRNASQVLAINGSGVSFPAGTTLNCSLEWTEE